MYEPPPKRGRPTRRTTKEGHEGGDSELEALAQGLHGIHDRTNSGLEKIENLESMEDLQLSPSLRERKRLEKNAKQAMKYWLSKEYQTKDKEVC